MFNNSISGELNSSLYPGSMQSELIRFIGSAASKLKLKAG